MQELSNNNFGIVIAYLIPGFVVLFGVSFVSETVRTWLGMPTLLSPTVGGFLYVTLASVAAGLLVSTIRWAIVDTIHHRTGVAPPDWRFEMLAKRYAAFELLIGHHYRHYQFHANAFVALIVAFIPFWRSSETVGVWWMVAFVVIETVLWVGSRDNLTKYYRRGESLLKNGREPVIPNARKRHRILNIEGPLR